MDNTKWTIVDSGDRIENEKGYTIASTCYQSAEENQKLAKLFYVAPKLLEALEEINNIAYDHKGDKDTRKIIALAEQAIKKATN
jgi:hypothetical protein